MARILGVDLPRDKRVEIGLTYIFGVGRTNSIRILKASDVEPNMRVKDLSDEEIRRITTTITSDYQIEGDLRREIAGNIKRLIDTGTYRGLRHRKGMPVRGQRTHTNARTRKGPRRQRPGKKR